MEDLRAVGERSSAGPPWGAADWRQRLARDWAAALGRASYIPLARDAVEDGLLALVDRTVHALEHEPEAVPEAGRVIGARLVRMHATGEDSLQVTLDVLREALGPVPHVPADLVLQLVSGVATGYAAADRENTFLQQESMQKALLRSKINADRELRAVETRFAEVFSTTPTGVAICALDGTFLQINPSLENMLGYRAEQLRSMTIHDVFVPEQAAELTATYRELAAEGGQAVGAPPRRTLENVGLVREGGEPITTGLAVSVLHGQEGSPPQLVTMVQDVTEQHLLQERFRHQALHDPLTGLPNRTCFRSRLQTSLANMPGSARLALYHLSVDGFELINDGLGYEVGDQVIKAVARRLDELAGGEQGLVARFGGTEFAVLLAERPDTPPVPELITAINAALDEPVYIGEYGIAPSASTGVVQRAVADGDAEEMLWAAETALRRAEAEGKRQWALFDPDRAPEERIGSRLAAIMPGGLHTGEFDVVHRPKVRLDDGGLDALETGIRWDSAEAGAIGNDECLRLAERSGVVLPLRDWLIATAWDGLREWYGDGYRVRLDLSLSPHQAADPDLLAAVRRVLEGGGAPVEALRLCVPVAALEHGQEARDNIRHLAAGGTPLALGGFRGSPPEIALLRDVPVEAVRLHAELVDLVHTAEFGESAEVRAVRNLIGLVRECGVQVWVDGLGEVQQERRWHEMGCSAATGPRWGDPVLSFDVPALVDRWT
ncbi:diguanylate cyclase [Saccharopolyspora sp. HNM0983]|uniref:Diguanylate cyclase n=1 Tax=Saccharopolyspora montiporae TaxID=2781240 RepID=A0A929B7W6_9PSEU|nr:diguanylate cyclase [Saccharopolyspora sp. HNM0983]MBE9373228.1 diguanylate cyclase [Saccharopolyspora sp. HNM0983]